MPIRYGGDMDDMNNPASPFADAEAIMDFHKDVLDNLPPTRKGAEEIVNIWQQRNGVVPIHVQFLWVKLLTEGDPVPPLPGEVNYKSSDWPVGVYSSEVARGEFVTKDEARKLFIGVLQGRMRCVATSLEHRAKRSVFWRAYLTEQAQELRDVCAYDDPKDPES